MLTKRKKQAGRGLHRQQGFSLMELCVAVAIAAIIAAIAIPALLGARERYRLRASATDVLSVIKRAQTEAVRRGAKVKLLFNAVNGTCTVFVDDGSGGGVAGDSIPNGTETVSVSTLQPGNSLLNITFPPTNISEFNSGGMPVNVCPTLQGPPPVPTCFVNIVRPANLVLQYRVSLNITGHTILQVSEDSGATWN